LAENREFRLWYCQPAHEWLEALPLGNGSLGAMLWGGTDRERADLNIDTLWSGGPRVAHVQGAGAALAQMRDAVLNRRSCAEADVLVHRLQGPFRGVPATGLADHSLPGHGPGP
jgi:alpha-L-fucosidase 2